MNSLPTAIQSVYSNTTNEISDRHFITDHGNTAEYLQERVI